ncbi:MAG: hypothetical protein NTY19_23390 [Planctomycetota bacterium]|nr:hypothetical protein [Planctomycetota bacterium]
MQLVITPTGAVRCIYGEEIDLAVLGSPTITRASQVEPDDHGQWWAEMSPVAGPRIGPYPHRSQALDAERQWLESRWLIAPAS